MAEDRINKPDRILVIGGSAGSINVLMQVIPAIHLPKTLSVVIVVHRKNTGDSMLVDLLSAKSNRVVKEVDEKEPILPGQIYVAPPDYHLLFEKDYTFSLDASEKVNYSRPSIDVTFTSAAQAYGRHAAALLLSGANSDGVEGLYYIQQLGGIAAVQDYKTAEVPYMPQQAIEKLPSLRMLSVADIPGFIDSLA